MIDYYKLEGRRIFTQSKLERIKRWYVKREHKIMGLALGIIVGKELGQWAYVSILSYFK